MKSFILGVLVTLVLGLGIQNHILTKELNQALKSQSAPKAKSKIKQAKVFKKKPKQIVQVIESEEERELTYLENKGYAPSNRVEPKTEAIAKYDPRDPRCPSIAPYYNERWGCLVIPR